MNENKNEEITPVLEEQKVIEEPIKQKKKPDKLFVVLIVLVCIIILLITYILYGDVLFKKNNTITNDQHTNEVATSKYRMSGNGLENFDLTFLGLENNEKNIVYSPLSIKYALEMLSDGANGTSKAQIDALVGDYTAKKYSNNANMSFANAMFINDTYKDNVKNDYTTNLSTKYNAEIIYDSFATSNNLNKWVSDKTFNLINNLFDDVSQYQFILTNALAIDMNWTNCLQSAASGKCNNEWYDIHYEHENYSATIGVIVGDDTYPSVKFDDNKVNAKATEIGASINNYDIVNTLGEDYIRKTVGAKYEEYLKENDYQGDPDVNTYMDYYIKELNSNYKKIDTSTDFSFYTDDSVKVFAKDLKEYNGTTLQYIGIMPNNETLSNYIKENDSTSLNSTISKLKTIELNNFESGKVTQITGYIPLFKYDYQINLVEDLKSLGVTDVFDINKADFSNLTTDSGVFIGDATHKANIEFSNEGIKASAATEESGLGNTDGGFQYNFDVPLVKIDLTFNKPYLYLIRDKNSGEIWFVGTVYQPIEK